MSTEGLFASRSLSRIETYLSSITPGATAKISQKLAGRRNLASVRQGPGHAQKVAERKYLAVLPVLFLLEIALCLNRSLLPRLLNYTFDTHTYAVLGIIETVKGVLAFMACPIFGKFSDVVGRRTGLIITVVGSSLPILALAITRSMWVYAVTQGLSGIFCSTFTIIFAYIADIVAKERRAAAYGMSLAVFGLSYCIAPIAGGFVAVNVSRTAVYVLSVVFVILAVAYIVVILPESRPGTRAQRIQLYSLVEAEEYLPMQWTPFSILEVFSGDPLLLCVAKVIFLYYAGVWAIVSTLMVHVQRNFHADEVTLGELMSVFGVCTMFAEGVLVRIFVPHFGEKISMQIGLVAFALQCAFFAFARHISDILFSLLFSTLANLVYPSVSSLVSRSVPTSKQGEALGAMNGIRALTEGFGPLVFGFLMYLFQDTRAPGMPYLLAGAASIAALYLSNQLPTEQQLFVWEKVVMREEGNEEALGLLAKGANSDDEDECTHSEAAIVANAHTREVEGLSAEVEEPETDRGRRVGNAEVESLSKVDAAHQVGIGTL